MQRFVTYTLALGAVMALGTTSRAASWTGDVSDDWQVDGNWDTASFPTGGSVEFGAITSGNFNIVNPTGSAYSPTFAGDANGDYTITGDGWEINSNTITVEDSSGATGHTIDSSSFGLRLDNATIDVQAPGTSLEFANGADWGGTNRTVTKTGTGTVIFGGDFGNMGRLQVNQGVVDVQTSVGTAGSGKARIAGSGGVITNTAVDAATLTLAKTGDPGDASYAGNITGNLNVFVGNSAGGFTQTLTGNNTYTGTTQIDAGRINVNGTHVGGGTYTVGTDGVLGGTGAVTSVVTEAGDGSTANGMIAPGTAGIATFDAQSWTWNSDDATAGGEWDLSTSDSSSDLLDLAGTFTEGDGNDFIFDFNGTGKNEELYTLVEFASTDFTVDDFSATNLASGVSGDFVLNSNNLQFNTIPEPASLALLGVGSLCLLGGRSRRRSA